MSQAPHENQARARSRTRAAATLATLVIGICFAATSWWQLAGAGAPMSVIDEHMHLDTHFTLHDGSWPHRGAEMRPEVVEEWACGVGHEGGATTVPCGDPLLGPAAVPSGQYSSGYIHYPTYFVGGEAYRAVSDRLGIDDRPINTYRHYAATVFVLGILVCAFVAWRLRLRGSALVAATFVPVAASGIALFGTTANPSVASVLCGALVAWTGIRWVLGGRGFWWLVAAGTLASVTSVTASLPVGAFILATLAGALAVRLGKLSAQVWAPRLWHAILLGVVVIAPVIIYGRVIEARATMTNAELYAFYTPKGTSAIVTGAVYELFTLHTPWYDGGGFYPAEGHPVASALRGIGSGGPVLITTLVLGLLAVATLAWRALPVPGAAVALVDATDQPGTEAPGGPVTDAQAPARLRLLAASTLVGVLLYPVALRISNAVTMGIDHTVVWRYSMSFAPLMVLLCLMITKEHPWYARVLSVLGMLGVLALGVAAW